MLAGIRDVLIIVNPSERVLFEKLFENSKVELGIDIRFAEQQAPNGLAEAFIIAKQLDNFEEYTGFALILGDNIFHGSTLTGTLDFALCELEVDDGIPQRATIFAQKVPDLTRFGVVALNRYNRSVEYIIEKPKRIDEEYLNFAVTGLYFFPQNVVDRASRQEKSSRGELEITDLIGTYLGEGTLNVDVLSRGTSWFDTGTPDSMLDAAHYVKTIQTNHGFLVGSPHEIAYRCGLVNEIDRDRYVTGIVGKSNYGKLLREAIENG